MISRISSDVVAHSVEVRSGLETTISCVISGITSTVNVEWYEASGTKVSAADNYTPNPGTFNTQSHSQTANLIIKGPAVTGDKTYTCRVTSQQFSGSPTSDTVVHLNVYGML